MSNVDRDRIQKVALTLFAAGGANGASLESVAEDVGLPLEALLEHFADIDQLFLEAIDWASVDLSSSLDTIANSVRPPAERLLLMTRRMGSLSELECSALFCVLRELIDASPRASRVFERSLRAPFDLLLRVIGESQFRGETAPLPPRFVATQLLCGVVIPQLLGFAGVEATLQGVHARPDDASEEDVATKPRSALLAAAIQTLFHGLMAK